MPRTSLIRTAHAFAWLALATLVFAQWRVPVSSAADAPLKPPDLDEVIARYPTILEVHWWNVSQKIQETPDGIRANVYQDETLATIFDFPGAAGMAVLELKDTNSVIKFDKYYCVTLQYFEGQGNNRQFSPESDRVCTSTFSEGAGTVGDVEPQEDPAALLSVVSIRGREELEWARVASLTPAYLLTVKNSGFEATGSVRVDISTSGMLTLPEQPAFIKTGWASDGFACAPVAASGGANAVLRCTGGTMKTGQTISPAVLVSPKGPGFAQIHVTISNPGETPESVPEQRTIR